MKKTLLFTAVCAMVSMSAIAQSPRVMVCEEGTGTWCGWCPRGIVGLETMKQNHPETFIGIAVHGSDVMEITSYSGLGNYISGYPGCQINRNSSYAKDPSPTALESCYNNYFAGVAADADISIEAEWATVEKTAINVKTHSKFYANKGNAKYRIALVLLENHVGPFNQQNYYAGGAQGAMGGWESKGSVVSWYYDDVARYISNFAGDAESLPTTIEAGVVYDYESVVPVAGLTNSSGQPLNVNPDNIEVVALLVCTSPRSIVNACKLTAEQVAENTSGMHAQEIIWNQEIATYYEPETSVELEATSSMGLPVSFAITSGGNNAVLEGNVLTFNGVGNVTVTATQDGGETCLPANPVSRTFSCLYGQVITWDQEFGEMELNVPIPLEATASSGLKVTYKLAQFNRNAKLSNGTLTFLSETTAYVNAQQAGNATYAPAPTVQREITFTGSGIEEISIDDARNCLIFDMQGVQVTNPQPGRPYVIIKGPKAIKAILK